MRHVLFVGFAVRLLIILVTEKAEFGDSKNATRSLVYTDIDYKVYSEAANYVWNLGQSPFNRHTYRYSPLVAYLSIPNVAVWSGFAKVLFSVCDVLIAWILVRLFKCTKRSVSIWWLFNPFVIVISTRGSADSIVCLLSLVSIWLFTRAQRSRKNITAIWAICGFAFGFAVHFKIYPVIYLAGVIWRLLKAASIKNLALISIGFVASFGGATVFFWHLYGWKFVYESLLFHVIRTDHRHNFSPFFYPLYLCMESRRVFAKILGVVILIPNAICLLAFTIYFESDFVIESLFKTISFVIFNKVITSQYYQWVFSLLPIFTSKCIQTPYHSFVACCCYGTFLTLHLVWNVLANSLENEGLNKFFKIWLCSLANFCVSAAILWLMLHQYAKTLSSSAQNLAQKLK